MTSAREALVYALGEHLGNHCADQLAEAMGRHLDAAVFYGTTQPIQENQMTDPLDPEHYDTEASHAEAAQDVPEPPARQCTVTDQPHDPHPFLRLLTGGDPGPVPTTAHWCPGIPEPEDPVHYVTPAGAMSHAVANFGRAALQGTRFPERVTCPTCCAILAATTASPVPEPIPGKGDGTSDLDLPQPDDGLTEAERLGLIVGAAYGNALAERDAARAIAVRLEQQLAEAMSILDDAVRAWPDTSWAADSHAVEKIIQRIETLKALESPETDDQDKVDG